MKTLYMVTVLASPLYRQVMKARPANALTLVQGELADGGHKVSFYSAILDGWDTTDKIVAKWICNQSNEAAQKWERLILTGRLGIRPEDCSLDGFSKSFSCSGVRKVFPPNRHVNAYAIYGLLAALCDGVRFKNATKCPLFIQRFTLGPTRGDSEYSKEEDRVRGIRDSPEFRV